MTSDSIIPPGTSNVQGVNISLHIIILAVLILLNALFAMAETAVISINDSKLKKLAASGDKTAKLLEKILKKPSALMMALKICVNLTSVFSGAYAAFYILSPYEFTAPVRTLLFVGISFVTALLVLLAGELIPRRIAAEKPDKLALVSARPLKLITAIFLPVSALLSWITDIVSSAFGISPDKSDATATEEEIRLLVDVGEEKGVIPETEKMMINNIFDFNDTTVSRIMTHRTDIVAIPNKASFEEIVSIAAAEGYTRLPVYDGTLDNIVGILHTKSLISHLSKSGVKFRIDDYLIKPYFVPLSKYANELFEEMQKQKIHIAVVVGEYGGTSGIITLEDLVESILGNIQDEYDDEENETEIVDDHTFLVDASASLDDAFEMALLDIPENLRDDFEYDTIGGFCTSMIDKIAEKGDSFTFENALFEIAETDDKIATKIKITTFMSTAKEDEE